MRDDGMIKISRTMKGKRLEGKAGSAAAGAGAGASGNGG